jgi:hypothetical protein
MIATLTTSLRKTLEPGTQKAPSKLRQLQLSLQFQNKKKAKQIRTRPKFPGSTSLKERIPKKSRSDQHAHEMISLTWKSIHHFTKQAGYNLANWVHPSLQAPGSCSHGECQVRREFAMQIRTRRLQRKHACHMQQRMSCFLVRVCKYARELVGTVKF